MSLSEKINKLKQRFVLDSLSDAEIIALEVDLERKEYKRWFGICKQNADSINELFHRAVIFGTDPDVSLFISQGAYLHYDFSLRDGKSGNILFVCIENDQLEMFQNCVFKDSSLIKLNRSDGANLLEALFEAVKQPRDIPSFETYVYTLSGFVNPKKQFTVRRKFLPTLRDPQFKLYTEMVKDCKCIV